MKSIRIKVLYSFVLLLQVALIAGAFILNFFATTRMGMKRWLNYKNKTWLNTLPIEELKIAVFIILCVATLILIIISVKKIKSLSLIAKLSLLVLILGLIAYTIFMFSNNVSSLRAYYYMLPFFSLSLLIQVVKGYFFVLKKS